MEEFVAEVWPPTKLHVDLHTALACVDRRLVYEQALRLGAAGRHAKALLYRPIFATVAVELLPACLYVTVRFVIPFTAGDCSAQCDLVVGISAHQPARTLTAIRGIRLLEIQKEGIFH